MSEPGELNFIISMGFSFKSQICINFFRFHPEASNLGFYKNQSFLQSARYPEHEFGDSAIYDFGIHVFCPILGIVFLTVVYWGMVCGKDVRVIDFEECNGYRGYLEKNTNWWIEGLPQMVSGVCSDDGNAQLEATTHFRKLLSIVNKEVSLFVEGSESMLMMKEVKNEDEAYDLYNEYAFSKGFGIRVGKGRKRQNSEFYTMKRFLCSCEGVKDEKRKRTRSYARLDTRTGCTAFVQFSIGKDGVWTVVNHNMIHNHAMVPLNKRHLIRSQRKVSKEALYFMSTLKASGVKVSDTLRVLRKEVGGSPMVGFTASDAYNALSRAKANKLEGHDCHQLIKYFAQRNSSEEGFYYDFELSEEEGLLSFFWRDGRMKRDYDYFGDLLVFDTTYRTNKYDMICAPFVGMNHHSNNVMFGMGFVINEKTESFNWLFQTFLTSMGGNPPITIMTDQAPSIAAGIRNVFPDARHRLCTWHIGENSKKHIGQYRALDGFSDIFNYLLKYCETAAEFEYHWPRMLTHYKCVENPWLKNLYTIREMWCPAYSKNYWSGGVLSSQRCETTNKSVSHRLDKTQGLCDFYHVFLDVISDWRSKENGHDYRNWKGRPEVAAANCGILLHA
ncbi:protein FAR1-RELATED SEQUENCE 5-like [Spinacia oleracea]|uniref:Protein FAR1-RELATED SEQUENCE 5-like n=1 Tax=Spinacia oleracea TaxID=3562 RepID=A0ABM3QVE5_SPIOL|nr:protein FAR1-RELATED SEQUENCE 5-like [Spinacia oleracea]